MTARKAAEPQKTEEPQTADEQVARAAAVEHPVQEQGVAVTGGPGEVDPDFPPKVPANAPEYPEGIVAADKERHPELF